MPPESLKLPTHFNLEPELRDQLSSRPGHQRCVEGQDELLLIVHEVPKPGSPEKVLVFWRRHDGRWIQPGGAGTSELEDLLGRYLDVVDAQQEVVTRAAKAAEVFAVLRQAGPLARSLRELTLALDEALSFDPDDRAIRRCCDRAKEIGRAADLLHADSRATLEFLRTEHGEALVKAGERLGRTVNRLSVLVVIFLPLTALGSFLAMNPSLPWIVKMAFWCIFLAGFVIAAAVLWLSINRDTAETTESVRLLDRVRRKLKKRG
jgi:hypothetical protein